MKPALGLCLILLIGLSVSCGQVVVATPSPTATPATAENAPAQPQPTRTAAAIPSSTATTLPLPPTATPSPTTTTPTLLPTVTIAPSSTPVETATPEPPPGATRVLALSAGVEVEQVYVPAGSFMMGSEDGLPQERPVHEVILDGFWIDRTEVTNAQFAAFVADTGYETTAKSEGSDNDWRHPQGSSLEGLDNHPVVNVSWNDAQAYATWAGGRLPTEAEWEYAARGPEALVYPWGNEFGSRLNFCDRNCSRSWSNQDIDDGYAFTAPVGTYPDGASWVGALDMAGNVWEWVNDWYKDDSYGRSARENPTGPSSGSAKALRGGAWDVDESGARAAYRFDDQPDHVNETTGFRVVEPLSDSDS